MDHFLIANSLSGLSLDLRTSDTSNHEYIGMEFPREGLNNQRIALFGLLSYCKENDRCALIPNYCIDHVPKPFMNSHGFLEYLSFCTKLFYYYSRVKVLKPRIPLSQIFAIQYNNCSIRRSRVIQRLSFKEALYFGFSRLKFVYNDELYKRIFSSISFTPEIFEITADIMNLVRQRVNGSYNCVSLRLEKDWLQYINSSRFVGNRSEINFFTKSNILNQMVSLSELTGISSFYCCADLNDLSIPFDLFKIEAARYGISLFTKLDFRLSFLSSLSSLTSASIDYLIALHSVAYLGSSRSTFSNLISLDSRLLRLTSHRDYVMNSELNHPVLRTDHIV